MTIGTYHHANASIILKPRADDDGLNDIDINVTDEVYVSEPAFVRRASDPNKRKSRDSSPEKKNDKNSAKSTPPPSRPSSSHKVDVSLHHNAGRTYFTNETQIAKEFVSFLKHFYEIFPELKAKKLWITGESYAGVYLPPILAEVYKSGVTNQLQGTLIVDGLVTPEETLDATTYQFAVKHKADFNFSEEDLQDIKNEAAPCNLTDYVERNLHYPAKPPLPDFDDSCSPYDMMLTRALDINENFNVYNVKKPHPTDNYDNIDYTDKFFDNPALQSYIHAPHKDWQQCSYVFLHGDNDHSPDRYPDQKHSVLAQVIEKSKKFVLVNGNVSIQTLS
ncbi:hypothetical protein L7F22_019889 [Adiantum nelumboides]|nr:hypothetical protein [Adiantum nelumboides]